MLECRWGGGLRASARLLLALATASAVAGCRTPSATPTIKPPEAGTGAPTPDPSETYDRFCAVCHGQDGKALTETDSPQLSNPALLASASDEFLRRAIAEGRPGTKMSTFGQAYGGPLSDAQVSAIVAHLRRWDTDDLPTPSAVALAGDGAAGEIIYAAMCAECHGVDGRSDTAPDLANPAFLDAATDAFLQYALVFGRPGTDMEPAGLTEQEMADVIAYIRAFGEP